MSRIHTYEMVTVCIYIMMSWQFGRMFKPLLKKLLDEIRNILMAAQLIQRVAHLHVGAFPQQHGKLLVVGVAPLPRLAAGLRGMHLHFSVVPRGSGLLRLGACFVALGGGWHSFLSSVK